MEKLGENVKKIFLAGIGAVSYTHLMNRGKEVYDKSSVF